MSDQVAPSRRESKQKQAGEYLLNTPVAREASRYLKSYQKLSA